MVVDARPALALAMLIAVVALPRAGRTGVAPAVIGYLVVSALIAVPAALRMRRQAVL
jgi:hypothetical protein